MKRAIRRPLPRAPRGHGQEIRRLLRVVRGALRGRDDLLKPGARKRWQTSPLAGHCYVACEVLWHAGLCEMSYRPESLRWEGGVHWRLRHTNGHVVDPTTEQFFSPPPLWLGRGRGFLTREPSARAARVLAEIEEIAA